MQIKLINQIYKEINNLIKELNLTLQTCKLECNICGKQFSEIGDKKLRKIIADNFHTCWRCTKYLVETPIRVMVNNALEEKEQQTLWNKMRRFQIITTGIFELDVELFQKFGSWKVQPESLPGT